MPASATARWARRTTTWAGTSGNDGASVADGALHRHAAVHRHVVFHWHVALRWSVVTVIKAGRSRGAAVSHLVSGYPQKKTGAGRLWGLRTIGILKLYERLGSKANYYKSVYRSISKRKLIVCSKSYTVFGLVTQFCFGLLDFECVQTIASHLICSTIRIREQN